MNPLIKNPIHVNLSSGRSFTFEVPAGDDGLGWSVEEDGSLIVRGTRIQEGTTNLAGGVLLAQFPAGGWASVNR